MRLGVALGNLGRNIGWDRARQHILSKFSVSRFQKFYEFHTRLCVGWLARRSSGNPSFGILGGFCETSQTSFKVRFAFLAGERDSSKLFEFLSRVGIVN